MFCRRPLKRLPNKLELNYLLLHKDHQLKRPPRPAAVFPRLRQTLRFPPPHDKARRAFLSSRLLIQSLQPMLQLLWS